METGYIFLQQYWWFIVSLLGALLVWLLFVQGGNSLIFRLGKDETERSLLVNATGSKWEFTFTTLVTFGGAFFASFPLFYSTSFGGAYWLWMAILFTFVLQAVAYEFQSKAGNLLGKRVYQCFLLLNGVAGPVLLGSAVGTFFNGAAFSVDKANLTDAAAPVISRWDSSWHGLEALADPWNLMLGLAVFFLARLLGGLYFIVKIRGEELVRRCRRQLLTDAIPFLVFFLAFVVRTMLRDGFAVEPETGAIFVEPYKYLHNMLKMPALSILFLAGVVGVLWGIGRGFLSGRRDGFWWAGGGTVFTVLALLLCAGLGDTAFYPSTTNLQSSLTLANSCSSHFTLKTMAYVSLLIPFVAAYISYVWRAMDRKPLTRQELENSQDTY